MKPARSKKEPARETLAHHGFRADAATEAAMEILEAAERRRGHRSPKSAAIRRALQEAAERQIQLDKEGR